MTNRELAKDFLQRYMNFSRCDTGTLDALEALLDMTEERGATKVEWACDDETHPDVEVKRLADGIAAVSQEWSDEEMTKALDL